MATSQKTRQSNTSFAEARSKFIQYENSSSNESINTIGKEPKEFKHKVKQGDFIHLTRKNLTGVPKQAYKQKGKVTSANTPGSISTSVAQDPILRQEEKVTSADPKKAKQQLPNQYTKDKKEQWLKVLEAGKKTVPFIPMARERSDSNDSSWSVSTQSTVSEQNVLDQQGSTGAIGELETMKVLRTLSKKEREILGISFPQQGNGNKETISISAQPTVSE